MFIVTSLDGFVRAGTLREPEKLQLYLAFGRSTTPIPGKGCAWRRKVGKNCNFTSRSVARPRQSLVTVARGADMLEKMCNFTSRSWEGLRVTPEMCNFTSRSVARPRQSIVIFDTSRRTVGKRCNFTTRSCVRPRQSMGRVARHAENLQLYLAFSRSTTPIHYNFRYVALNGWKNMQLYLAFLRSTTPIHGKGCASRRHVGKMCNFTSRSVARPRQSIVIFDTWR